MVFSFFFCRQKTAYELRISDWSSDVCSSDLFEDTLRLPCLATRAPAAATTKIDAVEILNVCAQSPPVPTMSTRFDLSATGPGSANSRNTFAAPATSSIVASFTPRPPKNAVVLPSHTSHPSSEQLRAGKQVVNTC